MKLKTNENFSNVPDDITTVVDVPFAKANEEHDENMKRSEEAMKANKKAAEDTIPKEGYTGKKISNADLKKMHLSESLFEEIQFETADYEALIKTLDKTIKFLKEGPNTAQKFANILDKVIGGVKRAYPQVKKLIDEDSTLTMEEVNNLTENYNFYEEFEDENAEIDIASDKLNSAAEAAVSAIESDMSDELTEATKKDIKKTADKLMAKFEQKARALGESLNGEQKEEVEELTESTKKDIANLADKLMARFDAKVASFNEEVEEDPATDIDGEDLEEELEPEEELEEALPVAAVAAGLVADKVLDKVIGESIQFDIAKTQLKKYNEGKMNKDWNPDKYLEGLVHNKHITEEESKTLKEAFITK